MVGGVKTVLKVEMLNLSIAAMTVAISLTAECLKNSKDGKRVFCYYGP